MSTRIRSEKADKITESAYLKGGGMDFILKGGGMDFIEFYEWLKRIWPLLKDKEIDKAERTFETAEVKVYWVGTIIRIDIKLK